MPIFIHSKIAFIVYILELFHAVLGNVNDAPAAYCVLEPELGTHLLNIHPLRVNPLDANVKFSATAPDVLPAL